MDENSVKDKKVIDIDVDALFSTITMIIYIIAAVICLRRPTITNLVMLMATGLVYSVSCIANAIRQKKIENINVGNLDGNIEIETD